MNHTEALLKALAALHEIGGAIAARNLLKKPLPNPVMRAQLEAEALSDHDIQQLALNTWEQVVLQVRPWLPEIANTESCPDTERDVGR